MTRRLNSSAVAGALVVAATGATGLNLQKLELQKLELGKKKGLTNYLWGNGNTSEEHFARYQEQEKERREKERREREEWLRKTNREREDQDWEDHQTIHQAAMKIRVLEDQGNGCFGGGCPDDTMQSLSHYRQSMEDARERLKEREAKIQKDQEWAEYLETRADKRDKYGTLEELWNRPAFNYKEGFPGARKYLFGDDPEEEFQGYKQYLKDNVLDNKYVSGAKQYIPSRETLGHYAGKAGMYVPSKEALANAALKAKLYAATAANYAKHAGTKAAEYIPSEVSEYASGAAAQAAAKKDEIRQKLAAAAREKMAAAKAKVSGYVPDVSGYMPDVRGYWSKGGEGVEAKGVEELEVPNAEGAAENISKTGKAGDAIRNDGDDSGAETADESEKKDLLIQ